MPSPYDDTRYRAARKRLRGLDCHYCGAPSTTVEHLNAVAQGGDSHPSNLVPCCAHCNSSRGGQLGAQRKRQKRREVNKRWL